MKNTVTEQDVQQILDESMVTTTKLFDKTTFVAVQLQNGFVITASSSCVDPANYNEEIGFKECIKQIVDRIWELEGYKLQDKVHNWGKSKKDKEKKK